MQVNIYVNNNGTFTVNAFDSDGYMAGALSRANDGVEAENVVEFINELRNRAPEDVRARVMLDGEEVQLNLFSGTAQLIHTLNACHPMVAA